MFTCLELRSSFIVIDISPSKIYFKLTNADKRYSFDLITYIEVFVQSFKVNHTSVCTEFVVSHIDFLLQSQGKTPSLTIKSGSKTLCQEPS